MSETIEELKTCKACGSKKALEDFYWRKDRNDYSNRCKKCHINLINIPKSTTHKVCKHCGVEKLIEEYQRAGGGKWHQPYCKPCDAERKREYEINNKEKVLISRKRYYTENKEVILGKEKDRYQNNIDVYKERAKKHRIENAEQINKNHKIYGQKNREILKIKNRERYLRNHQANLGKAAIVRMNRTPEQIEKKKEYDRNYKKKNAGVKKVKSPEKVIQHRERNRIYNNNKSATDISFRLLKNLRSRTRFALKKWDTIKSDTTANLLGCSIPFFKEYFSSLFYGNMTWEDFMNGDIHIDHKIPCIKFDLRNADEQRKCFNFSNLQPLWWYDNLAKGAKIIDIKTA